MVRHGSIAGLHQNELPYRPEDSVVSRAARSLTEAHRYPSRDAGELRGAIAARFAVDPDWVVAASGSISVIQQAMIAAGPGRLLLPWPSFDAFPPLGSALRMNVRFVGLAPDGACDLVALKRMVGPATRMVIVCTPNTPTGGVVTQHDLLRFLDAVPENVIVLVDQAYAEFAEPAGPQSVVDLVRRHPGVVVTRTFSKAYGLAGMRVGYGIAQPALAEAITSAGVPYPLTRAAEAAALVALGDQQRLRRNIRRNARERARLTAGLRALDVEVLDGHGNFVWLPMTARAANIGTQLAEAGLLVKTYPGAGIRITIGTPAQTDRLLAAWPQVSALTSL